MGVEFGFTSDYDKQKSFELCVISSKDFCRYGLFDYGSKLVEAGDFMNSNWILDQSSAIKTRRIKYACDTKYFSLLPQKMASSFERGAFASRVFDNERDIQSFLTSDYCAFYQPLRVQNNAIANFLNGQKATPLIAALIEISMDNRLTVISSQNSFYLILKKNSKLLLANRYQRKDDNDILYFSLLTYESYHLDKSNFQLDLAGYFDNEEIKDMVFSDYIRNVAFVQPNINLPIEISKDHKYVDLTALSRCV